MDYSNDKYIDGDGKTENVNENRLSKSCGVVVVRREDIMKSRSKLPIIYEEQQIIEKISENDVVIIVGETGCGKTTQLPQFLYEAGYSNKNSVDFKRGLIGITQPRRIAAIHMSERVGIELNLTKQVNYQVRYEGNTTDVTRIKFMTDGVLLKEIQSQFLLSQYSIVILDEAHERSLHTDVLIGLLSRIVKIRRKRGNPMKLVIMSATLCIDEFVKNSKLFPVSPPVIQVEARQFDVKVRYCRNTPDCCIEAAYKRIVKIHDKKQSGDILVFVASRVDIRQLIELLESKQSEINANVVQTDDKKKRNLKIFPLHALLPKEQQNNAFKSYGRDVRKCIVSTNVAETSVTIPGIRFVIDTGKVKQKIFNSISGAESYVNTWCSKASADQRKGRAGRTSNGNCYRLYSTAVFQYDFNDFAEPEILRQPLDNVVLELKSMNINQIANFPFPTPPRSTDINRAEKLLLAIGALESQSIGSVTHTHITEFGRNIGRIPLSPRYAALVYHALNHNCFDYMVAITSALSVRELFSDQILNKEQNKLVPSSSKLTNSLFNGKGLQRKLGDFAVLLNAVGASVKAQDTAEFCRNNGIRTSAVFEVGKISKHIINQLKKHFNVDVKELSALTKLNDETAEQIRKLLTLVFKDHIAYKASSKTIQNNTKTVLYRCENIQQPLRIHTSSTCFSRSPDYIIFNELVDGKYITMKGICEIESDWIS